MNRSQRASSATRVVLVDASSGVPLVTGILMWLTSVLLMLTASTDQFEPGWADAFNYLLTTVAFLGPVAAGAASLHAANLVRSGVTGIADTTSRGRPAALRVVALSVICWEGVAGLTSLVVLALRTDLDGARTAAMLLLLGLWASVMVFCAVCGTVIGSLLPSFFVPPTVAVVIFLWIYSWSYGSGKAQRLSPIFPDTFYRVWSQPNVGLVAAQTLVVLSLAALVWCALLRNSPTSTRFVGAVGVAVFVVGAFVWSRATADAVEFRKSPNSVACRTDGGVALCFWPESKPQVPASLTALARVHRALAPLAAQPSRFYEPGLQKSQSGRVFEVPSPLTGDYLDRAVQAFVPSSTCNRRSVLNAQYDLQSLFRGLVSGESQNTAITKVLGSSVESIRAWIKTREARISQGCR